MQEKQRRFYKIRSLAEATGLPQRSLYSLVASGEIESVRLGGSIYIPIHAAQALIEKFEQPQTKVETASA